MKTSRNMELNILWSHPTETKTFRTGSVWMTWILFILCTFVSASKCLLELFDQWARCPVQETKHLPPMKYR